MGDKKQRYVVFFKRRKRGRNLFLDNYYSRLIDGCERKYLVLVRHRLSNYFSHHMSSCNYIYSLVIAFILCVFFISPRRP